MNLEAGQVGVVLFGSDRAVKEGETVKRTGQIVRVTILDTSIGFCLHLDSRLMFLSDLRCLDVSSTL